MKPLTHFEKILILPLPIALALVALASPPVAQANEVTHWNQIATDTLAAFPPAAGGAPNALQVNMGMTQGAVYDAINAIEPRHRPYLLAMRFNLHASKEAAAATAAYSVLSNIVSTVPATIPFPNKTTLLQSLSTAYMASLAAIPDSPSKTGGIAAGNAAADAMIAARQGDGRFGPSPWVPNYAPGHWQPLRNPDGSPILDPTPWVANVRPFLIQSSSQFRTDGPNSLTSDAYAEDVNPDTDPDPSWTALLTAPYPEHPSGHLSGDSAHLEVLHMFFGTDNIRFGVISSRFPGETRYFDQFSDALKEIIDARIWAGLHFRTADVQAKILGRKVVHYMEKHYFQPLQ